MIVKGKFGKGKYPRKVIFNRIESESRKEYYDRYLKSEVWNQRRIRIMKLDKDKCCICGNKAIDVHHWFYPEILGIEKRYGLNAVCRDCHTYIHNHYNKDIYDMSRTHNKRKKKIKELKQMLKLLYLN